MKTFAAALVALAMLSGLTRSARADCHVVRWTNSAPSEHPIFKCDKDED